MGEYSDFRAGRIGEYRNGLSKCDSGLIMGELKLYDWLEYFHSKMLSGNVRAGFCELGRFGGFRGFCKGFTVKVGVERPTSWWIVESAKDRSHCHLGRA